MDLAMDAMSIAQVAVKLLRYVPFLTAGVLVAMCKSILAPRNVRAAALLGLGLLLGMAGWMVRYVVEQFAPLPHYDVPPTPGNILYVAAPGIAYDLLVSGGLVLAYASLARALSAKAAPTAASAPPSP
jgi:hypothetical protein